jgi:hypothetical protein
MSRKPFLWAIFGALVLTGAALSMIRRDTVTVPAWSIQFVDQLNRPFVGLRVEQTWRNYSFEDRANADSARTDERGTVTFPARYLRVSALRKVLGPLTSFLVGGGFHAGQGPHSWIFPKCSLRDRGPDLSLMRAGQLPAKSVLKFSGGNQGSPECARLEEQAKEADRLTKKTT